MMRLRRDRGLPWRLVVSALAGGLLAAPLFGCAGNACDKLAVDLEARYKECGLPPSDPPPQKDTSCPDVDARLSECLDKCLPKLDCGCSKDPTGLDCKKKQQPYTDCAFVCSMS